ncbi:MAG: DUF2723 domain-containing protein [Prolixibacteraceae bacterium]|nr:DUF2723 domain-containing protein [Prolixibacteraceae bacterium]MBN2773124.1 DUF2723 domain-containing protein [Prolixibacteraceae bacterium]
MKNYKFLNNLFGWIVTIIAAATYLLTIEPTASFWDCGEFITTSYKLEVGHPPGAPFFMILGNVFSNFAGSPGNVAKMINSFSALASAFTIMFLFWTITHLAKRVIAKKDEELSMGQIIAVLGSGMVGALVYTFSDTFWFSAVEGEVYATSSLLTAIVFWAILKWENAEGQPFANRWLILIGYIIGLSVGVHLLNLLAIPAIVFVYYFKKYPVTKQGIILSLIASIVILAIVMYGIIPGVVKIAFGFELLSVNTFGLPYNSGVYIYLLVIIALVVFGIHYTHRKKKVIWNTVILGVTVILLGYSSFALIMIRSAAHTPMDQNSPNNIYSMLGYLNREQYGERPLWYGQYYNSPLDQQERYIEGSPIYIQKDGKYVITNYRLHPNYDNKFKTVFPRMWSTMESFHADDYVQWGKIKGHRIRHTNEMGETETIVKPTFVENMRFFFRYHVGFMYFRYFMWNFAGRQDDVQSHGSLINGNWISGVKFIDNWRLGDQDTLPEHFKNNKAHNVYYFLPMILGILGIAYQYRKGNEGKKDLWVVTLLFVMTGLAIVVYLNQYPHQPRERDYAYAGSFYAFAIWIGLGVLALYEALKKIIPSLASAGIVTVASLFVPILMGAQNWDDHDRSGRYTARDLGANYLITCADNAIVFTNGDNDTFPLWYNQEVEGVGTNQRVCNLSYLQTDWYIDQMRRKTYESEPIPFAMAPDKYTQGTRDLVYLLNDPRIKGSIDLKQAMDFVADDNPRTKLSQADDAAYIPGKILKFPVDKEAVIRNKVVRPQDYNNIVDTITINLSNKNYLSKDEMMILDLIANNNWERPIYWAITVSQEKFLNLSDYFQMEGFAFRFVPIKGNTSNDRMTYGTVASDIMYKNLMEKFQWGNMNDPNIYLDENNKRMMTNIRNSFNRLAGQLINEGKKDSALAVVNRCMELIPHEVVPNEYFALEMADNLLRMGQKEKGLEIITKAFDYYNENLSYFITLDNKFLNTEGITDEVQRALFYLQKMERSCRNYGLEEMSAKINESFQGYLSKVGSV